MNQLSQLSGSVCNLPPVSWHMPNRWLHCQGGLQRSLFSPQTPLLMPPLPRRLKGPPPPLSLLLFCDPARPRLMFAWLGTPIFEETDTWDYSLQYTETTQ